MACRSLLILGVMSSLSLAPGDAWAKRPSIARAQSESPVSRTFARREALESTAAPPVLDPFDGEALLDSPDESLPPPKYGPMRTRGAQPIPSADLHSSQMDPVPAQWGNLEAPRPTPSTPPAIDYLLVRPPQGVAQQDWGNAFQQSVSNPEETYHHGPTFCTPIELDRPDGLAPIGVIGDHTLEAGGQFLISYRYSNAIFSGNRDGTTDLSTASVLANFPVAPTRMQTQRQMLLFEYGVTDDLTLLALIPFWDITIDQVTAAGPGIVNSNSDPGDVIVQALYVLWRGEQQQLHLNLGLQAPLGLDESQKETPSPTSPDKSYPLRTTSGTWDFMPGATYRGQNDDWTWGVQGTGTIRFGINNHDYKLGNRFELTGWAARRLSDYLSLSARLDGNIWADIFGADPALNPLLVPTNRPDLQGGRRIDLLFGLNLFVPGQSFANQWFSVEGGIPVFQFLQGPQLKTSWMITAGYNLKF